MSKLAIINVEGVLSAGDDLRNAQPTQWGRPLYDGIRTEFRTIAFTKAPMEIATWWLKREGFQGWSSIMSWNQAMTEQDWKIHEVRDFLAEGWEIGFILDMDSEVLEAVNQLGVLTMSLSYPANRLGWRERSEAGPRSWDQVVGSVT